MTGNGPGISVVIVSRGLSAMLDCCLEHLAGALDAVEPGPHRVVVVDNASQPPYPARKPGHAGHLRMMRLDTHHSFAAANNLAVGTEPNDLYLLLNNDVFLHRQALAHMVDLLSREQTAGICGTRLVFPSGAIQHMGVAFRAGRHGPYHWQRGAPRELVPPVTREWQAVTGACLLVRADVWRDLTGLDEAYPFGLEDVDFCLRARQRGWRVFCVGDTDSLHFEAQTPGRSRLDRRSRRVFRQRWRGRYAVDG